jgi:hypothetical protein
MKNGADAMTDAEITELTGNFVGSLLPDLPTATVS